MENNPCNSYPENTTTENPYAAPASCNGDPQNSTYGAPCDTTAAAQNTPYAAPYYTDPAATPYASPYNALPTPPKKSKKPLIIGLIAGIAVFTIILVSLLIYFSSDSYKYSKANDLITEGNYSEAISLFRELGDYEDSENKIMECNRRTLYDYLKAVGDAKIYDSNYTYSLRAKDGNLLLGLSVKNFTFDIIFDMSSDNGEFRAVFSDTTAEGDCVISELTRNNNSPQIDTCSGYFSKSKMQELVNPACNLSCMHIGTLIDKTELGLSPADIGFTSIDE